MGRVIEGGGGDRHSSKIARFDSLIMMFENFCQINICEFVGKGTTEKILVFLG